MPTVYASAEKEIMPQFYDMDPMEVVWHGNYVRYFEDARCLLLDSFEYNYAQMKESGYMWPVIELHIRYPGPLVYGKTVVIRADLTEYEFRLKIVYTIIDKETGKRLCRGHTVQVAVGYDDRKMRFASPLILAQKLGVASCE
jgi:acyl-CoA thioester hydrolase